MKFIFLAILLFFSSTLAYPGVLTTEEDITRGRKNLENPVFSEVAESDDGLSAAVRFILTENPAMSKAAKVAVEDALDSAVRNLFEAQCTFYDSSSQKLYEALVMYDLISGSELWDIGEREKLRESMKFVLDYYLRNDVYAWNDEAWSLGATPMRIVASCALFAFNFQDDTDFKRYSKHSRKYLENNIENSIDDYGAWIMDCPGLASHALEYLIVTARVLKNSGVHDYFSNPRLRSVLTYGMNLLPPQQAPLVKGVFMIAGEGQTDPGVNHGGSAVLAAADINAFSPSTASQLLWYWKQCGKPSTPLGLLFIDTSIMARAPEGKSMIAGGGMAVMRHNFGTSEECAVFAGFGDVNGIPDRECRNHSDRGNFSFVWRGTPLVVHDGFSVEGCSESIMNASAWRHNIVTKSNSGDTPVLEEITKFNLPAVKKQDSARKAPADFYPEGISQFLSTEMVDYVSGEVHLPKHDMPPASYYRHFLFLKPDALLIWDQIESTFPLEWNLWIPVETVGAEKSILHLLTGYGIDLEVLFAGAGSIDYRTGKPAETVTYDWPLIMRTESNLGTVTVSSLDLVTSARDGDSTCGMDILYNILVREKEPHLVGLIGGTDETADVLTRLGIPWESLYYKDLKEEKLYNYTTLMICSGISAGAVRALRDKGAEIDRYVKNGGSVLWICPTLSNWRCGNADGPEFVPAAMVPGGCPVNPGMSDVNLRNDIKISGDSIWETPRIITSQSLIDWLMNYRINSDNNAENRSVSSLQTFYVPASWSDSWKILGTVKKAFPIRSYSNMKLGEPSRIRVRHPVSEDFFTLLLPRKTGRPYLFDVTDHGPGYVFFEDNINRWEVQAGENTWTDANLSIRISSVDGIKGIYAFDCTFVAVEDERFRSEKPMSLYFSPLEATGIIMTAVNNVLSTSRVDFRLHAGEIYFYDFSGDIWTERISYITKLTAVDEYGAPVCGVKVYVHGRFAGSTGDDGILPVRWFNKPPDVLAKYGGKESAYSLVPGEMKIQIAVE